MTSAALVCSVMPTSYLGQQTSLDRLVQSKVRQRGSEIKAHWCRGFSNISTTGWRYLRLQVVLLLHKRRWYENDAYGPMVNASAPSISCWSTRPHRTLDSDAELRGVEQDRSELRRKYRAARHYPPSASETLILLPKVIGDQIMNAFPTTCRTELAASSS